jgi:AraC-like DNA-binding protein
MSEKNLRGRVRDALKPGLIQQIENMVGNGVPDTYYAVKGVQGWLELKYAENIPARASTAVFRSLNRGLDVEQEAWIFKCAQHGGVAHVYAQIGKRCYLVPGHLAYQFNAMTHEEFQEFYVEQKDLREALVSCGAARKV